MQRSHLIEIHEQTWCPADLRDALTETITNLVHVLGVYDAILPGLKRAIEASHSERILDLCSGAGGPWPSWAARDMLPPISVRLTDMFPHAGAAATIPGPLGYHCAPVDATRVDPALDGFRTLFTSLHHFRPPEVAAILGDAVACRQPVGVFEFTNRSLVSAGVMLLGAPLVTCVLTLLYPPRSWRRWVLTFVLPLIPLLVTVDGVISCFRSYRSAELLEMASEVAPRSYEWTAGQRGGWFLPITYLIGVPAGHGAGPWNDEGP